MLNPIVSSKVCCKIIYYFTPNKHGTIHYVQNSLIYLWFNFKVLSSCIYHLQGLCRIKLPKKATRTLIYPVLTFFENYQLQNTTGFTVPNALFDYSVTLSIESSVLLDPSIIDPVTGLPANGTLVFVFSPNRVVEDRTMVDGERSRKRLTFTRAGNAGISKANLIAGGLTPAQADDLFKSAITVHFNMTGRARYVTDSTITGNMRLFGD